MAREASPMLTPPRVRELRKRKFSRATGPQTGNEATARSPSQSAAPTQASQPPSFTDAQLALALSLQKSKPVELSTNDYIDQLRKRIKLGQEEQHRHVDTADFWKDQYSKLLLEKNAWELKAQSLASNEPDYVRPAVFDRSHDMAELNYKPSTCIALLRQTQTLVKQLTDANIDAITLTRSLQTTLLHMSHVLGQICEPPSLLKPNEDANIHRREHVEEVTHIVGLTYRQCLRGFNHLCRDIPGRQNKNLIIHSFSKLFSEILGYIHQTCQASVQIPKRSVLVKMTRGRTLLIKFSLKSKYDVINMSLSKLLVTMIVNDDFDESFPGHNDILEGYLFHLLQHTGSTLSEVIFLEQVSTTNTDGSQNTGDPTKTEPDPAAQNKARYLVYILSNIIRNNPKVPRMLNNLSNRGNFTRGKKATDGNGKLSTEAKMRLQHTLLKGVFGGDDFKSSLKEPLNPEPEPNFLDSIGATGPEQFSTEWFVESLWSLIGWDILSDKK